MLTPALSPECGSDFSMGQFQYLSIRTEGVVTAVVLCSPADCVFRGCGAVVRGWILPVQKNHLQPAERSPLLKGAAGSGPSVELL